MNYLSLFTEYCQDFKALFWHFGCYEYRLFLHGMSMNFVSKEIASDMACILITKCATAKKQKSVSSYSKNNYKPTWDETHQPKQT